MADLESRLAALDATQDRLEAALVAMRQERLQSDQETLERLSRLEDLLEAYLTTRT